METGFFRNGPIREWRAGPASRVTAAARYA